MKFQEYFERSSSAKIVSHILFLSGDDAVMKDIVFEDFGRLTNLWNSRERITPKDVRSIIGVWREGSICGSQLFDVRIDGKIKNSNLWKDLLQNNSGNDNYMVIRADGDTDKLSESVLKLTSQVVDCKFPRTSKEVLKLVKLRLKLKGCTLDDSFVKVLSESVKTSSEMENFTTTISLLGKSGFPITDKEILYVTGERFEVRNISRAILRGNIGSLIESVDEVEPMLLLSIWHSTLKKFYCWLGQISGEKEREIKDEEDDDGDEVVQEGKTSKPNKYMLKDYKIAKQKYSPLLVRKIVEDVNDLYQDLRLGRDDDFKERMRMVIGKII